MKKSHSHNVMSDRVCNHPGCEKQIKLRLVELKDVKTCYEHHCLQRAESSDHTPNTKPRIKRIEAGLPVKTFS